MDFLGVKPIMERWIISKTYSEYIKDVMDIVVRMNKYKDVATNLFGNCLNGPFLLDRVENGLFKSNAMVSVDKVKDNEKFNFVMYVESGNLDG